MGGVHVVGMTVPSVHTRERAEARSWRPTTSAVTGVAIVQKTPLIAPILRSLFVGSDTMDNSEEDHYPVRSCEHPDEETS